MISLQKIILSFMICALTLNGLAYSQAKNNDPVVTMLKQFYIEYNTVWATNTGNVLIKKLDSLQLRYCTRAYYKELKKEFKEVGLDHDELINDAATDVEHLNTLKILKDSKKVNEYIASYIVFGKDVSEKPLTERIIIHVLVMKDGSGCKIAAVKNGSYTVIPNK